MVVYAIDVYLVEHSFSDTDHFTQNGNSYTTPFLYILITEATLDAFDYACAWDPAEFTFSSWQQLQLFCALVMHFCHVAVTP